MDQSSVKDVIMLYLFMLNKAGVGAAKAFSCKKKKPLKKKQVQRNARQQLQNPEM